MDIDIRDCIEKIAEDGDIKEMVKLAEILVDLMEILKEYDEEAYKKYEMHIYKMAYGSVLSRQMAETIVSKMKPYGQRWTIEETKEIQEEYGIDNIRPVDFFIVMNSKFNDNRDTIEKFSKDKEEELEMYICLSKDFILDEDAKEGKIFNYFTTIPY